MERPHLKFPSFHPWEETEQHRHEENEFQQRNAATETNRPVLALTPAHFPPPDKVLDWLDLSSGRQVCLAIEVGQSRQV